MSLETAVFRSTKWFRSLAKSRFVEYNAQRPFVWNIRPWPILAEESQMRWLPKSRMPLVRNNCELYLKRCLRTHQSDIRRSSKTRGFRGRYTRKFCVISCPRPRARTYRLWRPNGAKRSNERVTGGLFSQLYTSLAIFRKTNQNCWGTCPGPIVTNNINSSDRQRRIKTSGTLSWTAELLRESGNWFINGRWPRNGLLALIRTSVIYATVYITFNLI